jgi:hypothetical protein
MSVISLSSVDSNDMPFDDVARLVGLTDDDVTKLKEIGMDMETDLALISLENLRRTLDGSNEMEMKVNKLRTLGKYIIQGGRITVATTMEHVYQRLEEVTDNA